jgi:heat-inducible transcriptional repressor
MKGYLYQPHPSSGRIPTDQAYRVYVNTVSTRFKIPKGDTKKIVNNLQKVGRNYPDLFIETCKILSQMTNNIGVVLSPSISKTILEHIEFVKLDVRRILVLFIAKSGMLHNKILEREEDFSQNELMRMSSYLVNRMKGKTLIEIRDELVRMIQEEKAHYDALLKRTVCLAEKYFESGIDESELFVEGTFNLFDKVERVHVSEMRDLFKAFEEKSRIVKILNQCIDREGVKVLIGSENSTQELRDYSLITSSYHSEGRSIGALGIIGPKRIEYPRVINLVGYLSKMISQIISRPSDRFGD